MRKVTVLVHLVVGEQSCVPGDTVELDDYLADELVAKQQATEVEAATDSKPKPRRKRSS